MKTAILSLSLLLSAILGAQTAPEPLREADFTATPGDNGSVRFSPVHPPLRQIAGAPPAFYTCLWEFGDGAFSFLENPAHTYADAGEYVALLDITNNYDDGKKPRKRRKSVLGKGKGGSSPVMAGVFETPQQAIALKTGSQPRAGEQLTCIVSYQNNSPVATDGRLHLFFNEKNFSARHFRFDTARTYFGERVEEGYTLAEPPLPAPFTGWVSCSPATGDFTFLPAEPTLTAADLLTTARGRYREEHTWRFTYLRPGEIRNVFVDLSGTASMLKDTSAFIHLEGVFEPLDPAVPADRFELEVEIVSSHDPNRISVSDNRVNYRGVKKKELDYRVRFQNNGEGPASTVALDIEIPEGLNLARMQPLAWYPECPICPQPPGSGSCLDTATGPNALHFTFRNIYLPGSNQKGVSDRDSTKGFVKYRLVPEPDMPKRDFRSRAKIVFDKNPPIYTNFSKTRFKPGLSPGLKAGYHVFTDGASAENYVYFGASLSPYKSWKIYPQIEILTGIRGKTAYADQTRRDTLEFIQDATTFRLTVRDSVFGGERGFFTLEVPVLLRKNFTRFVGAGLGGSLRLTFETGETRSRAHVVQLIQPPPGVPPIPPKVLRDTMYTAALSTRNTAFALFGDLTLGAVRRGPNVGVRAGAVFRKGRAEVFVQVGAEWRF